MMTSERFIYMPALRLKPAEQGAISKLVPSQKAGIRPLFEVLPNPKVSSTKYPLVIAQNIIGAWGVRRPFFFDPSRLGESTSPASVAVALRCIREAGGLPLVVVPLKPNGYHKELISVGAPRAQSVGAAVRVRKADLPRPDLLPSLLAVPSLIGLEASELDLVIDFERINGEIQMQRTAERLGAIHPWKSVTLLGGSFPPDLSGFKKNDQYTLPRLEWMNFSKVNVLEFPMPCAFGDYTVVSPEFKEPPVRANFSASIRYTSDSKWVLMRGEGVFNDDSLGFGQYPAQALLLSEREEFCGPEFSAGDRYIAGMSQQTSHTGTARTWLEAGINHHIVFVGEQLAA